MQGVNLYAVIVVVLGLQMGHRIKLYYAAAWGKLLRSFFQISLEYARTHSNHA